MEGVAVLPHQKWRRGADPVVNPHPDLVVGQIVGHAMLQKWLPRASGKYCRAFESYAL